MKFNDFQAWVKTTLAAGYPSTYDHAIRMLYCACGLAGEAGEVANKVKKIIRDDNAYLGLERREMIIKELGGVLWYFAQMCTELGIMMSEPAITNQLEIDSRCERGTVQGDGDTR